MANTSPPYTHEFRRQMVEPGTPAGRLRNWRMSLNRRRSRRLDGFVAKYLGDGAPAYFGYPQAHEDDAERAVRAGLELIAGVTALKSPVRRASPVSRRTSNQVRFAVQFELDRTSVNCSRAGLAAVVFQ